MRILVRLIFLVLFSVAFGCVFSFAQVATTASPQVEVTFYSSASFLKSAIPLNEHSQFRGRIMDGHNQLAMLGSGKFVTFHLDPGKHIFAANSWMIASPAGGGHLTMNLAVGQHYYIGAYLQQLVVASRFRLEQRTCEEAKQDNKSTEPLKREHLREYGLARVVDESSFPTCPQPLP